jgi:hypothetical protein
VRSPVLRVRHTANATYEDAWAGAPLQPTVRDGFALVAVEIGPKAVGCVTARR